MKAVKILLTSVFLSSSLWASVLLPLEGTIAHFDDKSVVLNVEGGKISVPRSVVLDTPLYKGKKVSITLDEKTEVKNAK